MEEPHQAQYMEDNMPIDPFTSNESHFSSDLTATAQNGYNSYPSDESSLSPQNLQQYLPAQQGLHLSYHIRHRASSDHVRDTSIEAAMEAPVQRWETIDGVTQGADAPCALTTSAEAQHRHVCYTCGSKLVDAKGLRKHEKRHNPDSKTHHCDLCSQKFCEARDLKRHVDSVHLDLAFDCLICGMKIKRDYNFTRHLKNQHSLPGDKIAMMKANLGDNNSSHHYI